MQIERWLRVVSCSQSIYPKRIKSTGISKFPVWSSFKSSLIPLVYLHDKDTIWLHKHPTPLLQIFQSDEGGGGGHFPLTDIYDQKIVFEKQHQTLTRSTTKSLSIRRLSSCNFSSFSTAKRIFSAISLMLIPKKKIQLRNVLCWATVSCLVYTWPNIFRIHWYFHLPVTSL